MMSLGLGSRVIRPVARRVWLLGLVAVVWAALLVAAGCSGGSSSGPGDGGGNNNRAQITGAVAEQQYDLGGTLRFLANVPVTFTSNGGNTVSTQTDAQGTFTLNVPENTQGVLRVTASGYYDSISYSNSGTPTPASLANGISVTSRTSAEPVSVGTIRLKSTEGPPPPPAI
jgi:hypothetical protein